MVALAQPLGAARVYSCAELKQAPIPNTTITLAQAQPASTNPPAPAHCEIVGKINERVGQDGKPYAIGFRCACRLIGTAASSSRGAAAWTVPLVTRSAP